jgi:uncharacterized protein
MIPGNPLPLLEALATNLSAVGIQAEELREIDHVCYRVTTLERYEKLRNDLSEIERLADESEINGRPIAIFELGEPILFGGRSIPALELPAPGATTYVEGYEHAEYVVEDLDLFLNAHTGLPFNLKNMDKPINRDASLSFDGGITAKFHERPILDVVVLQRQTGNF